VVKHVIPSLVGSSDYYTGKQSLWVSGIFYNLLFLVAFINGDDEGWVAIKIKCHQSWASAKVKVNIVWLWAMHRPGIVLSAGMSACASYTCHVGGLW